MNKQLARLESQRGSSGFLHQNKPYETIFPRVVRYGIDFRSILHLLIADSTLEEYAAFTMPPGQSYKGCYLPAVFLDTLLHAPGFIANTRCSATGVGLCVQIESIRILFDEIDLSDTFSFYCSQSS